MTRTRETPGAIVIRDALSQDQSAMLAINNASVPFMNTLDAGALSALLAMATYARVAEDREGVAGFLLAMADGAPYASPNYRWFSAHYPRFLYVDRIAIAVRIQRRGIGSALYDDIAGFATGRWPVLLAEVNDVPPNPGSVVFHTQHDFVRVGELAHTYEGAHALRVQLFARPLP